MFPKNTWYVAATSDEIESKPLGRTIYNEKIAFFRGKGGVVAAVEDFCPHRGAALSLFHQASSQELLADAKNLEQLIF